MLILIKYFLYRIWLFFKCNEKSNEKSNIYEFIIFSKDRPTQLNLLLESLNINVEGSYVVKVLYATSDFSYKIAYTELEKIHSFNDNISFYEEQKSFKSSLISIISVVKSSRVFFLVDDIIFKEKINLSTLDSINTFKYVFSLRNGVNLNYSYVVQKKQSLPSFVKYNDELLSWKINEGELDWSYPLSVDGHLFSFNEVNFWVRYLEYNAPNTFEMKMQIFNFIYKKKLGLCFNKSIIFNNPCNKVQSEVNNLHGSVHQEKLLEFWNQGFKINYNTLNKYNNRSVHEEVEFKLVKR